MNLTDYFIVNDTLDISNFSLEQQSYCTNMLFRLCSDPKCKSYFSNETEAFLENYEGIYNINNESVSQQLVIKTDVISNLKIYVQAFNHGGKESEILLVYSDICGDEQLSRSSGEQMIKISTGL